MLRLCVQGRPGKHGWWFRRRACYPVGGFGRLTKKGGSVPHQRCVNLLHIFPMACEAHCGVSLEHIGIAPFAEDLRGTHPSPILLHYAAIPASMCFCCPCMHVCVCFFSHACACIPSHECVTLYVYKWPLINPQGPLAGSTVLAQPFCLQTGHHPFLFIHHLLRVLLPTRIITLLQPFLL